MTTKNRLDPNTPLEEIRIKADSWATVKYKDLSRPTELLFMQGTTVFRVELSDDMAAAFGISLEFEGRFCPDDEPLIDPDCRDGKCGSCVGGPCEHDCHDKAALHGSCVDEATSPPAAFTDALGTAHLSEEGH